MTNKERKEIFNKIPHNLHNTQQQTELWDYFALQTEEHDQEYTRLKPTPQELPSTPVPKQTYLEATLSITKIKPETKQKPQKNKKRKQEQLLKITDAWKHKNEQQKSRKIIIKNQKKQKKWQEYKGPHDDVCDACNKGGELIMCHTCSRCNHWDCDKNMPMHVYKPNVIYRCPTCRAEAEEINNGPLLSTQEEHKWYTTTTDMNIAEAANYMNTTADDYLHFLRKFHPWGTKNHKQEIKNITNMLVKHTEIPYRHATNHKIQHDTAPTATGVGTT